MKAEWRKLDRRFTNDLFWGKKHHDTFEAKTGNKENPKLDQHRNIVCQRRGEEIVGKMLQETKGAFMAVKPQSGKE